MKINCRRILILCLALVLFVCALPAASAYTAGDPYRRDLSHFIEDEKSREYVEMMMDYHIRTDRDIRNALEGGFSAVFLFDGCSDNMNDPELSDLSYYRVSGICIVIRQNEEGELKVVYYNEEASTIPDRPLAYGAWELPEVGEVGPATIFDGTYQLYSVLHRGEYEALHVRSDYRDGTLDAVYMTPEGFTTARASEINIHTRTSNHIAGYGMWSAGCPLVADGNPREFNRLLQATYYKVYEEYAVDNFIGTLTVDRQQLRQELYTMYKDPDAVDTFLANSRNIQPQMYLQDCSEETVFADPENRYTKEPAELMSLPCTNAADARSSQLAAVPEDTKLQITGSIRNADNEKWHMVTWEGVSGYLHSSQTKPESTLARLKALFLGQ